MDITNRLNRIADEHRPLAIDLPGDVFLIEDNPTFDHYFMDWIYNDIDDAFQSGELDKYAEGIHHKKIKSGLTTVDIFNNLNISVLDIHLSSAYVCITEEAANILDYWELSYVNFVYDIESCSGLSFIIEVYNDFFVRLAEILQSPDILEKVLKETDSEVDELFDDLFTYKLESTIADTIRALVKIGDRYNLPTDLSDFAYEEIYGGLNICAILDWPAILEDN